MVLLLFNDHVEKVFLTLDDKHIGFNEHGRYESRVLFSVAYY